MPHCDTTHNVLNKTVGVSKVGCPNDMTYSCAGLRCCTLRPKAVRSKITDKHTTTTDSISVQGVFSVTNKKNETNGKKKILRIYIYLHQIACVFPFQRRFNGAKHSRSNPILASCFESDHVRTRMNKLN